MAENLAVIISGRGSELIKSFRDIANEADSSGKKTHSAWSTAGKIAGAAVAGLAGGALAVGVASVKMASDYEQSHARLVTALTNSGSSWAQQKSAIDQVEASSRKLGFTDNDTEDALATMTRGMGSAKTAVGYLGIAQDLARAKGVSLAAAGLAVTKGFEGQLRPLKQMGIDLPIAAGGALKVKQAQIGLLTATQSLNLVEQKIHAGRLKGAAASDALTAASQKLTAAQNKVKDSQQAGGQVLAALGSMLDGSASNAADTFEGKQRMLRAEMDHFGVQLGQMIIPILEKLASFLVNTVVPALQRVVGWVQSNWPKLITAITPVIDKIRGYITGFVNTVLALWRTFGGTILSFIKGTWNGVREVFTGALNLIMGLVRFFKDLFTGNWSALWGDVLQILKGIWQIVWGVIQGFISKIVLVLQLAWTAIGGGVKAGWKDTLSFFQGLPGKIWTFLSGIPGKMLQLGKDIVTAIVNGIKSAGGALAGAFKSLFSHLPGGSLISGALSHIPGFASGGTVPGPRGAPQLIIAHGGEQIVSNDMQARPISVNSPAASAGGGGDVHITIMGSLLDSQGLIAALRSAQAQLGPTYGARVQFTGSG